MRRHALSLVAAGVVCASMAPLTATAAEQIPPPPLLFREVWAAQPHEGAETDLNMRVTPAVLTNPRLEMHLYGPDGATVRTSRHEGRIDLWNGMASSPVAITLRDKANYLDLTGLARLRWVVRTTAIHAWHPTLKLADGTLIVASRPITTDGDFLQVDIAFGGLKWFKLDPARVVVQSEVKNPDLSKVDEIGMTALAPAGGHGVAASGNLSTVELYAKPVPR